MYSKFVARVIVVLFWIGIFLFMKELFKDIPIIYGFYMLGFIVGLIALCCLVSWAFDNYRED